MGDHQRIPTVVCFFAFVNYYFAQVEEVMEHQEPLLIASEIISTLDKVLEKSTKPLELYCASWKFMHERPNANKNGHIRR